MYGSGSAYPILLDGHPVGLLLVEKQFFFWQLDQGFHQLLNLKFSCAGGDLYFFERKTKSSGFFTKHYRVWTEVEQPDAVTGRKAIAKRQLTLNITEPSD